MKKVVLLVTCMTTLCLYGSYYGYDSVPWVCKQLETDIENLGEASRAINLLASIDCSNLASEGEREALEWTRKYLERYPPEAVEAATRDDNTGLRKVSENARTWALDYLVGKGDERCIEIVSQYSDTLAQVLKMRVAGMNVFDDDPVPLASLGTPAFLPSVKNTGPQAVYVREILYRSWEEAGRDSSKIPQELLAMVVSFDEDDNPVCSVDLAKYGLTIPIITPRPDKDMFHWWIEREGDSQKKIIVQFPDLAEPVEITPYMKRKSPDWKGLYIHVKKKAVSTPSQDKAVPSPDGTLEGELRHSVPPRELENRLWLPSALAALTLLIGGLYAWRKKLK